MKDINYNTIYYITRHKQNIAVVQNFESILYLFLHDGVTSLGTFMRGHQTAGNTSLAKR